MSADGLFREHRNLPCYPEKGYYFDFKNTERVSLHKNYVKFSASVNATSAAANLTSIENVAVEFPVVRECSPFVVCEWGQSQSLAAAGLGT